MDRLIALLTLLVDIGILWILIEEFNYDKIQDDKKEYKRKKANEKAQITRSQTKIGNQADMVPKQGTPGSADVSNKGG